jgi:ADP-ribose pyrophosphatase YjhB (NUDIX family)
MFQITLIREYCQGPNTLAYNLPTGGFEPSKHKSIEECAAAELSEEVGLILPHDVALTVAAGKVELIGMHSPCHSALITMDIIDFWAPSRLQLVCLPCLPS